MLVEVVFVFVNWWFAFVSKFPGPKFSVCNWQIYQTNELFSVFAGVSRIFHDFQHTKKTDWKILENVGNISRSKVFYHSNCKFIVWNYTWKGTSLQMVSLEYPEMYRIAFFDIPGWAWCPHLSKRLGDFDFWKTLIIGGNRFLFIIWGLVHMDGG